MSSCRFLSLPLPIPPSRSRFPCSTLSRSSFHLRRFYPPSTRRRRRYLTFSSSLPLSVSLCLLLFPSFSPLRTTSLAIIRWKYSQAVRAVRVRGIALIKSPGDEHRDTVIEPDEGVIGPLGLPRRTFSLSLSLSLLPPLRPLSSSSVHVQCTYCRCERSFKSGSMNIARKRAHTHTHTTNRNRAVYTKGCR